MFHQCLTSVSPVFWKCFKVVCLHWSHRSYPSTRRACFDQKHFLTQKFPPLFKILFDTHLILLGYTLDAYWIHIGSTLDPHWIHIGYILDTHWIQIDHKNSLLQKILSRPKHFWSPNFVELKIILWPEIILT